MRARPWIGRAVLGAALALLGASAQAACLGKVLMVVADPAAMTGWDSFVQTRLSGSGYTVTLCDDDTDELAAAAGQDWVYISTSVLSTKVNPAIRALAIPIFNNESNLTDELRLGYPRNYGTTNQTQLNIVDNGVLAGGSTGLRTVSSLSSYSYASPPASANVVASIPGSPGQAAIFYYAPSSVMAGGYIAPAKRLGYFLGNGTASALNAAGVALFDLAVQWIACVSPPAPSPTLTPTAIPVGTPLADPFNDASFAAFWTARDIGSPVTGGQSESASLTVSAGGCDIWDYSDQFRFVFQPVNGNFDVTLRINSAPSTNANAKVGLMLRAGEDDGAAHVMVGATFGSNFFFQSRSATAADATSTSNVGLFNSGTPGWVRLTRAGNSYTGYWSSDGSAWNLVATGTFPLPSACLLGIAVTSHSCGVLGSAAVNDFAVLPPTPTFTPTVTPTATPSASPTASPSATATFSPTVTPTVSGTATPTATPTITDTDTPTVTDTDTPTVTDTDTPTVTDTDTPTVTDTDTPTVTETDSPTVTDTDTPTVTETDSPTVTDTDTPTVTGTATPTVTDTDTPTVTETATPTVTDTDTPTVTATATPTATDTDTPTVTATATPTATDTDTPTVTATDTPTATDSDTPTVTGTATPTATDSDTPTVTGTATPTATDSDTPTDSPTSTPTHTASATATDSPTVTPTATETASPTPTFTATPTGGIQYDLKVLDREGRLIKELGFRDAYVLAGALNLQPERLVPELGALTVTAGAWSWAWTGDNDAGQPLPNGLYELHLTQSGGPDLSAPVWLQHQALVSRLTLAPNPAADTLHVFWLPRPGATARLSLYTLAGERVGQAEAPGDATRLDWPLCGPGGDTLASGIYFVCLEMEGQGWHSRETAKLAVIR